jgi:hypothetical protein
MTSRNLKRALLPLTLIAVVAASATSASAADICVGASPLCTPQTVAGTTAGLASALVLAQDGSHPGFDRIIIKSGTYLTSSSLNYTAATNQGVAIIGQGDSTILQPSAPGIVVLNLNAQSAPGSSITGVRFAHYTGAESGIPYGLTIRDGDASNLSFDVAASSGGAYGVSITGGSLTDSSFTVGNLGYGALLASNTSVSRLNFVGDPTSYATAIKAQGGTDYSISRVVSKDFAIGISTDQGKVTVSDSLIDLGSIDDAYGIWPHNNNNGTYSTGVDASNVTIAGTGNQQYGVRTDINGSGSSSIALRNSILSLSGTDSVELFCANGGPTSTATVNVTYSLFDFGRVALDPECTTSIAPTAINRATVAAPFADAGARNFQLTPTSPAVDAGDPAVAQTGATDLLGNPRVIAIKNGCAPRLDLGAYELQPASACTPPPPPPKPTAKFGKVVGKFKIKKPAKSFTVSTKKPKSRVPIAISSKLKVKLTMKLGKKMLKGSQSLTIPAGTSYLTFSGKFAGKTIKPGKYSLYMAVPGLKDKLKSTLSVIR